MMIFSRIRLVRTSIETPFIVALYSFHQFAELRLEKKKTDRIMTENICCLQVRQQIMIFTSFKYCFFQFHFYLFRFPFNVSMQTIINCRVRTVFLSLFAICLVFIGYLIWPWCYASWIWQNSTIYDSSHLILNTNHLLVPRILHQTWRDDQNIPSDWQKASNSCRSYHSNYEYRLWTDTTARQLIEQEFPSLLSTYDSYPYDIQRADVIRLVVLYVYGGIYLDLDIVCLKSFDFLRQYEFVLPRTMPVGLSNDFILATPKHPFLYQILTDLPKFNRRILTK